MRYYHVSGELRTLEWACPSGTPLTAAVSIGFMISGRFGPCRTGRGQQTQQCRKRQVRWDDRHGVCHIHPADRARGSHNRLAGWLQAVDEGQAEQRTVASARHSAVHPGHHVKQRRRGRRHLREQRSVGLRKGRQTGDAGRTGWEDLNKSREGGGNVCRRKNSLKKKFNTIKRTWYWRILMRLV